MSNKPTINVPPQGRTIAVVGDVYRFLATGEDTNGKYAMWEAVVPPGGGPPPHIHSREEEGFYILEGEVTFTVHGEKIVAKAGTFANMPVGTPHSFKNENSAERIDRLGIVANRGQAGSNWPQQLEDLCLQPVGILELVDQHTLKALTRRRTVHR